MRNFQSSHSINFSVNPPIPNDDFFTWTTDGAEYSDGAIVLRDPGSSVRLEYSLDEPDVKWQICFLIKGASKDADKQAGLNILLNGQYANHTTLRFMAGKIFSLIHIYIDFCPLPSAANEIVIERSDDTGVPLISFFGVYPSNPDILLHSDWQHEIDGAKYISDINMPGSHDAAAIRKPGFFTRSLYACHDRTITEQLLSGVRVFDIRIKVKKGANGLFWFATCHGSIGLYPGSNEYKPLVSVLDECKEFLLVHKTEGLVLSLKIDDWNGYRKESANIFAMLAIVLASYPIIAPASGKYKMCTMEELRGKMFLLNRLENDDVNFGAPVGWTKATPGEYATGENFRDFKIYVQDKFQGLSGNVTAEKTKLVTDAFCAKNPQEVLFNFASATNYGVLGVYIAPNLLAYFGQNAATTRTDTLGWVMLDREGDPYFTDIEAYNPMDIVSMIIDSNFQFRKYPRVFKVNDYTGEL
jgi:hypothetical protein